MNMASYSNSILELLSEVGKFLKETLENEVLSVAAEKQRTKLLHQLESLLRNASPASPETPPPYLDMNGGKGKMTAAKEEYVGADPEGTKVDEVYYYEEFPSAPVPCVSNPSSRQASPSSTNTEDNVVLALPFRELQLISPKSGPLLRKDKFIFLENWRRSWAGIHMRTLLLYNGERDAKPCFCIDLQDYEARRVSNNNQKDVKKKEALFEIVCPGKKTYQFVARTAKDMEQWIAAICSPNSAPGTPVSRRTSQDTPRRLPSLPVDSEAESEEYDDIGVNKTIDSQENYEQVEHHEEEFYQDIADFQPQHNDEEQELPPELPPRMPLGEECYEDIPEGCSKPQNMRSRSKKLKQVKTPLPPKLWTEQNSATPEEEEELYDDIAAINPDNVYYNMPDANINDNEQKETTNPEDNNTSEAEEEIYDDIGVKETLPDSPFKTAIHSNSNGGRIHHLIQRMEATLTVGSTTVACLRPNAPLVNNKVLSSVGKEELYEPIDDPGSETCDNQTPVHIPPQLPPRGNAIRS